MSIKKTFLKTKPVCKVRFELAPEFADGAESVYLVGSFNDWNESTHPMKPLRKGGFTLTLDFPSGENVEFRYLVNGTKWINDNEADSFAASGFAGEENSVLHL